MNLYNLYYNLYICTPKITSYGLRLYELRNLNLRPHLYICNNLYILYYFNLSTFNFNRRIINISQSPAALGDNNPYLRNLQIP